jgi:hypothetical protein
MSSASEQSTLLPEPPVGTRTLVDTPAALDAAAAEIAHSMPLALDVEAGKPRGATTTVAALIQIAAPGHTWLVDPLRLAERLGPLDEAFKAAPGPVALFDAPGDVRWLEGSGIHLPAATDLLQVTRSAYGERDKSLREALRRHFRVALDKSGQQADWLARPISGPLRHYAARDAELTLALAQRYGDLFPRLMAVHTYPGGRAPIPADLPLWLRRVLGGDRAPAYELAEEDGLPIDQEASIAPLLAGAERALSEVQIPWLRGRLYRAIANLDLDELAPQIAGGLGSECAVERTAALRALGDLNARDYAEAVKALRDDPVPDVARAAARAFDALRS